MFNEFFNFFVIGKSMLNRTNLMTDNKEFFIKAMNMFIQNDFVSIKVKNYMILLKNKIISNNNKI